MENQKKFPDIFHALSVNRVVTQLMQRTYKIVKLDRMIQVELPHPVPKGWMYFQKVLFLKENDKRMIVVLGTGQVLDESKPPKLKGFGECQKQIVFMRYKKDLAYCVNKPKPAKIPAYQINDPFVRVTCPKLTMEAQGKIAEILMDGQNTLCIHSIGGRLSDDSFIGHNPMNALADFLKEDFKKATSSNGMVANNFTDMVLAKLTTTYWELFNR